MTLSLIEKMSTWYEIDKDNAEAVAISNELREAYPKFLAAWRDLILYADANKHLLTEHDAQKIPFDLKEQIDSKMRQLRAMGFQE